jgi:predicted nucleic acid-binding protein
MIATIAIDTNIVIRYFNGDEICKEIISAKIPVLSIISEIELLSWPQLHSDDYNSLDSFLSECFIVNLSPEIKNETIVIRKKYGLKVPDAIIAATATTKNLTLFSSDDIFKRITHLNFVHVV